ncbi:MAG: hypothetical protein JW778_01685 [Candidatus Altiarchaeota archaeon]|nr:hypothetical protein [Candidatus Altiarchaeota archaeon]
MKKMIVMLASVIMLAATAAATVINFDDLVCAYGDSPQLPTNYGGITWDSEWFYWSWEQPPYTPSSPNTRIATHNYGGWMEFPQDVDFTGAYFSGTGVSCYFEGYDDGVLVGTSATIAMTSTPQFLNANFASVDNVSVVCNNYNYFAVDDVTFETETISTPEPALAIGILSLLVPGMIYLIRKRE